MTEPASGPQRSRSVSATSSKAGREKRKRSRVTPEQLVHLERFFAVDRSPTAARRKEISDMLGMQERQTQIWFQNRRAKAKLQDGKKGRGSSAETPPDTPPQLATGYEAELHSLLHEDDPVTIIPCTDLSVGTWRRIATTLRKHDLVAYLCDAKRCLTWFIHSSGYGFKMEIPFDIIVDTEFANAAPGSGLATFILSQPPTFYLESFSPSIPGQGTEPVRQWKKCADWTEDQQATKVLRHNLVGSAVQLAHVLRHLSAHTSGSDIRLHSPNYHAHEPSPAHLEIQLDAFTGTGYHYPQHNGISRNVEDPSFAPERSFSTSPGAPAHSQHLSGPPETAHLPVTHLASAVIRQPHSTSPYGSLYPQYSRPPTFPVNHSASFPPYSESVLPPHISHPPQSLSDYGSSSASFSPHDLRPRPYSAGSVHSVPYDDDRVLSYPDDVHPSGSAPHTPFETPSPPLLTTPFPPGSTPNNCVVGPYDSSLPLLSGVPGIPQRPEADT